MLRVETKQIYIYLSVQRKNMKSLCAAHIGRRLPKIGKCDCDTWCWHSHDSGLVYIVFFIVSPRIISTIQIIIQPVEYELINICDSMYGLVCWVWSCYRKRVANAVLHDSSLPLVWRLVCALFISSHSFYEWMNERKKREGLVVWWMKIDFGYVRSLPFLPALLRWFHFIIIYEVRRFLL